MPLTAIASLAAVRTVAGITQSRQLLMFAQRPNAMVNFANAKRSKLGRTK